MQRITHCQNVNFAVNNAGVTPFNVFECIPMELMKKVFEVNYFGTVRLTKAVLPFMKAKESGHIINMSSHAGVVGFPSAEIYSSSKFAVEGLTESLAPSLRQFNIRYRSTNRPQADFDCHLSFCERTDLILTDHENIDDAALRMRVTSMTVMVVVMVINLMMMMVMMMSVKRIIAMILFLDSLYTRWLVRSAIMEFSPSAILSWPSTSPFWIPMCNRMMLMVVVMIMMMMMMMMMMSMTRVMMSMTVIMVTIKLNRSE